MDEKRVYRIYVGVMRLHKKYAGKQFSECLNNFITDINAMNNSFSSNFCNAMTDILRQWFLKGFYEAENYDIAEFYTDLWRFHKRYLTHPHTDEYWPRCMDDARQIDKKYASIWVQKFITEIMNDLEINSIDNGNQEQRDNGT